MATARTVYRDFSTDGVPSSGRHTPKKSEIREYLTGLEAIINAFTSSGGLVYQTRAALYADLAHGANSMAWVTNDADPSKNGIYQKSGASGAGAWARVADLPHGLIVASDVGDGTPNAIQATTATTVTEAALVLLNVFEANTGSPVTVSFNGGTALTIKTAAGGDVPAGGLTAGLAVLGRMSGSTFRLLSDYDSAANQAGAEAARDLAREYANAPEDEVVETGLYSAKHWALKAQAADAGSGAAAARDAAVAAKETAVSARTDAVIAAGAAETARGYAEGFAANASAAAVTAGNAAALAVASSRFAPTWTELAALTGSFANEGAEVPDTDTGTHTDPVVGGTVANAGRYSWSTSPAGWKRTAETGLSSVVGPNVLWDPWNEVVSADPIFGGYYQFGPNVTSLLPHTNSGNIPVSTPVRQVPANISGDRYWPFASLGARVGDVITVAVLVYFAANGGAVSAYIRDASNNVLASASKTGIASGVSIQYLAVTVPSGASANFMIRANHATAASEVGAYGACVGRQRPGFSRARAMNSYFGVEGDVGTNLLFDPVGFNLLQDGVYFSAAGKAFTGTLRSSPNSPWGAAGIYSADTTVLGVRRKFDLTKLGLKTGDLIKVRIAAYFGATGGGASVYVRDAAGANVSDSQVNIAAAGSGYQELVTRTLVLGRNANVAAAELVIDLFGIGGVAIEAELLGVAMAKNCTPSLNTPGPVSARDFGRVRRQRNLCPDPLYRLYTAGVTTVDSYPLLQEESGWSVVDQSANPFRPKKALFISDSFAKNRRISLARLGLKVGEKITVKHLAIFTNANPAYQFGFNFRKADTTVIQTETSTVAAGAAQAGVPYLHTYVTTVTQAMIDDGFYLELRYNTQSVTITGGHYILYTGIYVGEEYPLLTDDTYVEDELRIALAAASGTVVETPSNYRAKSLREFRQRWTLRDFDEASRNVWATMGDSLTHNYQRYTGPLLTRLLARKNDAGNTVGDGGGGWTGFASGGAGLDNGNVRPSSYGYSRTGSWNISAYTSKKGPDLGAISSSTAGDRVTLTVPASPTLSEARLLWEDTADGVIRYSWDNGTTWTPVNTQGTVGNTNSAAMSVGMPAGTAGTLLIEVVSGSVVLFGINWKSTANGLVLHKLGSTGSSAAQWATAAASPQWQAALALLAPNTVSVMLGTNDNSSPASKATFKGYIQTIVAGIRAACPAADIWLIAVAQTPRVTSVAMSEYAAAMYEVAKAATNGIAFTWLQDVMGDPTNPTQYAFNGIRPWYTDDNANSSAADDVHPTPATGGRAMVGDLYKTLFYYP